MDALLESKIQFIPTRHEQGAAFMADVYGRLTGKASVCLATLGPGATNLITGVADANMDRAPVAAIARQTSGRDRCQRRACRGPDGEDTEPCNMWAASRNTFWKFVDERKKYQMLYIASQLFEASFSSQKH